VKYAHWHQTARTSQIRVILQPVWFTCKTVKHSWARNGRLLCDTVSVSRAYTYHVAWILGKSLDFSLKTKAKTLSPRPRLRPRPSSGVLGDPRGQGQASRTTRLLYHHYVLSRMLLVDWQRSLWRSRPPVQQSRRNSLFTNWAPTPVSPTIDTDFYHRWLIQWTLLLRYDWRSLFA